MVENDEEQEGLIEYIVIDLHELQGQKVRWEQLKKGFPNRGWHVNKYSN